jgi:hypothetical protein
MFFFFFFQSVKLHSLSFVVRGGQAVLGGAMGKLPDKIALRAGSGGLNERREGVGVSETTTPVLTSFPERGYTCAEACYKGGCKPWAARGSYYGELTGARVGGSPAHRA